MNTQEVYVVSPCSSGVIELENDQLKNIRFGEVSNTDFNGRKVTVEFENVTDQEDRKKFAPNAHFFLNRHQDISGRLVSTFKTLKNINCMRSQVQSTIEGMTKTDYYQGKMRITIDEERCHELNKEVPAGPNKQITPLSCLHANRFLTAYVARELKDKDTKITELIQSLKDQQVQISEESLRCEVTAVLTEKVSTGLIDGNVSEDDFEKIKKAISKRVEELFVVNSQVDQNKTESTRRKFSSKIEKQLESLKLEDVKGKVDIVNVFLDRLPVKTLTQDENLQVKKVAYITQLLGKYQFEINGYFDQLPKSIRDKFGIERVQETNHSAEMIKEILKLDYVVGAGHIYDHMNVNINPNAPDGCQEEIRKKVDAIKRRYHDTEEYIILPITCNQSSSH